MSDTIRFTESQINNNYSESALDAAFASMNVSGFEELIALLSASAQKPVESRLSVSSPHIDEAKTKVIYENAVHGYLASYEIEDMIGFDSEYPSFTPAWQELAKIAKDRFYTKEMLGAMQYPEDKSHIENAWAKIEATYNEKIRLSQEEDAQKCEEKDAEFDKLLKKALSDISAQKEIALKQREDDYRAAVKLYKKDKEKAVAIFRDTALIDYKNSKKYVHSYINQSNDMDDVKGEVPKRRIFTWKRVIKVVIALVIICGTAAFVVHEYIPTVKESNYWEEKLK